MVSSRRLRKGSVRIYRRGSRVAMAAYMSWKRIFARSNALEASERSMAVSIWCWPGWEETGKKSSRATVTRVGPQEEAAMLLLCCYW